MIRCSSATVHCLCVVSISTENISKCNTMMYTKMPSRAHLLPTTSCPMMYRALSAKFKRCLEESRSRPLNSEKGSNTFSYSREYLLSAATPASRSASRRFPALHTTIQHVCDLTNSASVFITKQHLFWII